MNNLISLDCFRVLTYSVLWCGEQGVKTFFCFFLFKGKIIYLCTPQSEKQLIGNGRIKNKILLLATKEIVFIFAVPNEILVILL